MWQQCLDDETQCYYYWNYETNDVTWEIPVEFSQYLLLYAEYEQVLSRYEQEYAEWKKARRRHRKCVPAFEHTCYPYSIFDKCVHNLTYSSLTYARTLLCTEYYCHH